MRRAGAREAPEVRRSAEERGVRGPDKHGNYLLCCPFCPERAGRDDREWKLTVKVSGETAPRPGREPVALSLERGVYNCYRCEARGFADFSWLPDMVGELPEGPVAEPPPYLGPPEGFFRLAGRRFNSERPFVDFLRSRGVLSAAVAVGVGAALSGPCAGRVVVPHYPISVDDWGGWSARLVTRRRGPKYLYPTGMDRRAALWGRPFLGLTKVGAPVWIVEGVFDALPLFPHAVATLGKSVTDEQLDALVALGRPLIPCLDGDAWAACMALAAQLSHRGGDVAGWCHLPPAADPGVLGWRVREFIQPLGVA